MNEKSKEKTWSAEKIKNFQQDFLEWYQKKKRVLPWREDQNPYHIWISEIMLQQTRVETVIDYYYRFMAEFPTVRELAEAPEDKLLKVWEGLGYYSRARNLQAAAQQIMEQYNGHMPATVEEIRTLKGIGPYTTGAIASIAFNLPEPAVDGNVMRVVSRLFCIDVDIAKAGSRKIFEEKMRSIITQEAPGDFNQAMMDLGSAICTPKSPSCSHCPLNPFCLAYEKNCQEDFPVKSKKPKQKDIYFIAGIIENHNSEFLLRQRDSKGLLATMWLFPLEEVTKAVYEDMKEKWQASENTQQLSLDLVAEDEEPEVFQNLPVVWQKKHFDEVTHVFTHLKWHILPFYGKAMEKISLLDNEKWVSQEKFSDFVFPKVQYKILESWQK